MMVSVRRREGLMKAHYFFYYSALSAFLPFISVLIKDCGVTAAEVGLIYAVAPFFSAASKPIFGAIVDRSRMMKMTLLIFILTVLVTFAAINFAPWITEEELHRSRIKLSDGALINKQAFGNDNQTRSSVQDDIVQSGETVCNATCFCLTGSNPTFPICLLPESLNNSRILNWTWTSEVLRHENKTLCNESCAHTGSREEASSALLFGTFWLFFIFVSVNYAAIGCANSLTDASCFELLQSEGCDEKVRFGFFRLWGTVGWGIFTAVSGYIIDRVNEGHDGAVDYSAGFCLCAVLMVMDGVCVALSDVKKTKSSSKIVKDVTKMLLHNTKVVFLLLDATVGGIFVGIVWQYHFMYLKYLGASQGLMGAAVTVRSFGELPIFFCAGWLNRKWGHVVVLRAALLAMAMTFGLYSVIVNPWITLPVELLFGLALGVFFTAMPSYAEEVAPRGTEATTLGLVTGFFEGVGTALGGIIGGVGFHWLECRVTFQIVSLGGFLWCITVHLLHLFAVFSCDRSAADKRSGGPCQRTSPGALVLYTAVDAHDGARSV